MENETRYTAHVIWHDEDNPTDPLATPGWTIGVRLDDPKAKRSYGHYQRSNRAIAMIGTSPLGAPRPAQPMDPTLKAMLEQAIAGAVDAVLQGHHLIEEDGTAGPGLQESPGEPNDGILRDFVRWLEAEGIIGERRRLNEGININAVELRGTTDKGAAGIAMLSGPLDMELECRDGDSVVIRVPVSTGGHLRFKVSEGAWTDRISHPI